MWKFFLFFLCLPFVFAFNSSNSEFVLVKSEFGNIVNGSNSEFFLHGQSLFSPVFNSSNADFLLCVGFYCVNPRGVHVVRLVEGNVFYNTVPKVECPLEASFKVLYQGELFCASKVTIERFKWQRFFLYFVVMSGLVLFLFFRRRKKRKVLNTTNQFSV